MIQTTQMHCILECKKGEWYSCKDGIIVLATCSKHKKVTEYSARFVVCETYMNMQSSADCILNSAAWH